MTNDPTIYSVQTSIAGNPLLTEERGTSWGVGFVWDIMEGMSLTADWYRIRLEDAASQLGSDYILRSEAACRLGTYSDGSPAPSPEFCANILGLVTRTVAPGSTLDGRVERINDAYINTALQDTSGVDASFKYRMNTENWGRFDFDLGYTMVLTNRYKQLASEELEDYRDVPPSANFIYPERSRARGSISWSKDEWSAAVFGTRYGSAFSNAEKVGVNTAGGTYGRRLQPYMLYNAQVGYRFSKAVKAELSVVNVLNNQYREDNSYTAYPFFNPYLGADPLGRRYFLSVSYAF